MIEIQNMSINLNDLKSVDNFVYQLLPFDGKISWGFRITIIEPATKLMEERLLEYSSFNEAQTDLTKLKEILKRKKKEKTILKEQSIMTREEKFAQAKQERKQHEQEEQSRKGFSYDYEDINYCALEEGKQKIVRVLGNPLDGRENGSDPKGILFSKIVGDDDKNFNCVWPSKEIMPNWILWKVYDTVMAGKWDKAKDARVYFNQESHPEIFNRVNKNGKTDNPYEKGWKPKSICLLNVIDREQMDKHKELKHTFVLSRNAAKSKNPDIDTIFYDVGVPMMTYKKLWDDVVEFYNDYEQYDIAIERFEDDPYYKVIHAVGEKIKIKDENLRKLIVEGPLTEEELSWERYDFDKLYKVTSYQKILKKLGIFIQRVDVAFKKNYYEELKQLAEEEKEKYQAENEEAAKKDEEAKSSLEKQPEKKESTAMTNSRRTSTPEVKEDNSKISLIDELKDLSGMKGISLLTDDELAMINGYTSDGEGSYKLSYNVGPSGLLYKCIDEDNCGFLSPKEFHYCPKCGKDLTA